MHLYVALVVKQYMMWKPDGSLDFFCLRNGHSLKHCQLSGILVTAVENKLGLPKQLYAAHSFRIGRAINLAAKGILV